MVHKTISHLYGGLFLEKRKILLPWGISWNELENLGRPKVEVSSDCQKISLNWDNELILDGIETAVTSAYHPEKRQHGFEFVFCPLKYPGIYGDPWEGLDPEYTHIVNMAEHPKRKLNWGGYVWEIQGIDIILYFWSGDGFQATEDFRKGIIIKTRDIHLDPKLLDFPIPDLAF